MQKILTVLFFMTFAFSTAGSAYAEQDEDVLSTVLQDLTFHYDDPETAPTGLTSIVDNTAGQLRVFGTADPHTSRFVHFFSNGISLESVKTIIFEADISLPTGNRNGLLSGTDPSGGESGNDSMGTPIFFQTSLGVQVAILGALGTYLEQVTDESGLLSPDGSIAESPILMSTWSGGPAGFDPLGLTPVNSIGSMFHVKLSMDIEKYKVMAEITPHQGHEFRFNAMPGGCEGVIAAPLIAITNLFDFTKSPGFDNSVSFSIAVRVNGNDDVDDPSAPGGTLRYIDREFTNVRVLLNEPIQFPTIPQSEVPFPADDFDSNLDASQWLFSQVSGVDFIEAKGMLELTGLPHESGFSHFLTGCTCGRQDATVEIDFKIPSGINSDTHALFRVWFDDPYNYFEIDISQNGYTLVRAIDGIYESGYTTPLFGDENTVFHSLKLSYKDLPGRIKAFVDNIQLDGIPDKIFSGSFLTIGFGFFINNVEGSDVKYQWDNFASSIPKQNKEMPWVPLLLFND